MPERKVLLECPKSKVFKGNDHVPAVVSAKRVRDKITLFCPYKDETAVYDRCTFDRVRRECDIEIAYGLMKRRPVITLPIIEKSA